MNEEGNWRAGGSVRGQEPENDGEPPEPVQREAPGPSSNQAVPSSEAHSGHTGWRRTWGYSQDEHFIKGMPL